MKELKEFYAEVNKLAAELENTHAERLNCKKGCSACCIDNITIFETEAENIRRNHTELIENENPHEKGMCTFLAENGACRIYENRPYVCRTQGLPFR